MDTNYLPISNNDAAFMDLSLKVADQSECKFKHGAVIVHKGKPIITAPNIDKILRMPNDLRNALRHNHCAKAESRRKRSTSIHAEVHAILRSQCNLRGATLYSGRITRQGHSANSAPCESCWQIISVMGISTVVYFDDNGEMRKIRV